jgi:hypothetical protein
MVNENISLVINFALGIQDLAGGVMSFVLTFTEA